LKTSFDFHYCLAANGENLTQPAGLPAHFLPGGRPQTALKDGLFMPVLTHLPVFAGVSSFYAENTTMAQPLLKGELR